MNIDKQTVKKTAHLARLEFNEKDEQELVESMNKILDWMESLKEVDTENVEPLRHMSVEVNVLREDIAGDPIGHKEALSLAPKKDSDYFRVPKVLE
ncbi:MAG: Asp-tRNA(Asn)/Glu-tRNA(Gln) amidotransferase subunit GatC [Cytophagales bacterium]